MPAELGAWLRQQREVRGWARPEMARRLIQAGKAAGDKSIPGQESMCHNIYRWERGTDSPTERYRLYYSRVLGILPSQFGPGRHGELPAVAHLPGVATPLPAPAMPGLPEPAHIQYAAGASPG